MQPYFLHVSGVDNYYNIGDEASCPAQYFKCFDGCPRGIGNDIKSGQLVIAGGGGLFMDNWGERLLNLVNTNPVIFWGAGLNLKDTIISQWVLDVLKRSKLAGIRDSGLVSFVDLPHVKFVPCCSSMNEALVEGMNTKPIHSVVAYYHSWTVRDAGRFLPNVPSMENMDKHKTPEDAIRFLAQGAAVVTNSYHGAYWAGLMGRKVVAYQKNDDIKFKTGLRFPIIHARGEDEAWEMALKGAEQDFAEYSMRLHRYAILNRSFCREVLNFVNQYDTTRTLG